MPLAPAQPVNLDTTQSARQVAVNARASASYTPVPALVVGQLVGHLVDQILDPAVHAVTNPAARPGTLRGSEALRPTPARTKTSPLAFARAIAASPTPSHSQNLSRYKTYLAPSWLDASSTLDVLNTTTVSLIRPKSQYHARLVLKMINRNPDKQKLGRVLGSSCPGPDIC